MTVDEILRVSVDKIQEDAVIKPSKETGYKHEVTNPFEIVEGKMISRFFYTKEDALFYISTRSGHNKHKYSYHFRLWDISFLQGDNTILMPKYDTCYSCNERQIYRMNKNESCRSCEDVHSRIALSYVN